MSINVHEPIDPISNVLFMFKELKKEKKIPAECISIQYIVKICAVDDDKDNTYREKLLFFNAETEINEIKSSVFL
jgi:hypothetical protein